MSDKYYKGELKEFEAEYNEAPFVPFPSVADAIEALTETAGWIIDGDEFLRDVLAALKAEVDRRERDFEVGIID